MWRMERHVPRGGGNHRITSRNKGFCSFCGSSETDKKLGCFGFGATYMVNSTPNCSFPKQGRLGWVLPRREMVDQSAPASILPHKGGCNAQVLSSENKIAPSLVREGWDEFQTKEMKLKMRTGANNTSKRVAFTLAEVLITLGIIGVVAAMTLPTLINNAQNKQLEVAFKKSYSALSQIAQRVALEDYGGQIPDNVLYESLGYYAKYLNGKRCTGTAENGCPANADGDNYCNFMYKTYKDFSGKVSAPCIGNDYVVNVVSGSTFYFDYAGEGEDIYAKQFVVIDVNGWQKRPNRLGYDLFLFSISRDGKVTAGGAENSQFSKNGYCNSSTTFSRNGYGCTINAINEKDYFKKLPH